MTPAEIMDGAANLIEQTGWTQGALARDVDGWPIHEDQSRAVCFCATGAISRTRINEWDITVLPFLPQPLTKWNDAPGRTKAEVLAALRDGAVKWRRDHP